MSRKKKVRNEELKVARDLRKKGHVVDANNFIPKDFPVSMDKPNRAQRRLLERMKRRRGK